MPKNKSKTSKNKTSEQAIPVGRDANVNIKKARNGFVISSFGDRGNGFKESTFIAKSKIEAGKIAKRMLKI